MYMEFLTTEPLIYKSVREVQRWTSINQYTKHTKNTKLWVRELTKTMRQAVPGFRFHVIFDPSVEKDCYALTGLYDFEHDRIQVHMHVGSKWMLDGYIPEDLSWFSYQLYSYTCHEFIHRCQENRDPREFILDGVMSSDTIIESTDKGGQESYFMTPEEIDAHAFNVVSDLFRYYPGEDHGNMFRRGLTKYRKLESLQIFVDGIDLSAPANRKALQRLMKRCMRWYPFGMIITSEGKRKWNS